MARILALGVLAAALMMFGTMAVIALAPWIAGSVLIWLALLVILPNDKSPTDESQ
jgi:hypothetical protein